jgi:hypothetical protein
MLDGESMAEKVDRVTLLSLHPSSMLVRIWERVLLERHLVDHESFLQVLNVETEKSSPFSFLTRFTESQARSTQKFFCIGNSIEPVASHMNVEREREHKYSGMFSVKTCFKRSLLVQASCKNPHQMRKLPSHHTKKS